VESAYHFKELSRFEIEIAPSAFRWLS